MTALDELAFEGRPFDALAAVVTTPRSTSGSITPGPVTDSVADGDAAAGVATTATTPADLPTADRGSAQSGPAQPGTGRSGPRRPGVPATFMSEAPRTPGAVAARIVAQLRGEIVAAHLAAMDVQTRWQEQMLTALGEPGVAAAHRADAPTPSLPAHDIRGVLDAAAADAAAADGPAPDAATPDVADLGAAALDHSTPTARLARTQTPTRGVEEPGSPAGLLRVVIERVDTAGVGRLVLTWTGPAVTEPLAVRGGIARAELVAGEQPVLVVEGSVVDPAPALALAPAGYRPEGGLEPLATTPVTRLGDAELAGLAAGRAGDVFGPRYAQPAPALPGGPLTAVTELRTGGPIAVGVLRAATPAPRDAADVLAAGWHAASVLAVWLGLHLVVPDAALTPGATTTVDLVEIVEGEAELIAEVVDADLLPRPWLALDAELRVADRVVARLCGLTLRLRGTPAGTREGGEPPAQPVRRGVRGGLAAVDELALATASVGDLTPALGPEFARYTERRATRPPAGGLRLVGRVMEVHGTRGDLSGGAVGVTEYDSAADAWYYGAAPSPTVPNVILMETSLQSALLLGYHLGATLVDAASDYCLRNLDGSATLHRDVDLRGRTIHQRSTLLTTTVLTGAVLQGFTYELWLDGEDPATVAPFYSGQSLFGFFTATALANQTGLDNGASVPNWLDQHPHQEVRMIDAAVGASGPLELLTRVEVVDGGGRHGGGYLRAVRPVDPADWFFTRHFHLDPVMPGSLGIEAVIQALQAWLLDNGGADGMTEPEFVVPAGVEFTWRYRGQILAGDGEMTLEVHIRDVERAPGRVRVVADASLWRVPNGMAGLRIYELDGIAAEVREKGAPSW
ncbi:MAG: hypothetical protein L0I76_20665 [Pseudonocardia sp.]|nr:hypothetical protein [Pseudonocardia sp.]